MKRSIVLLIFFLACFAILAAQSLEAVVAIGGKPACSMADLSAMTQAIVEAFPDNDGLAMRLRESLLKFKPDKALTKARASFVVGTGLRIRSSFLFLVIHSERYAFRALVVDGIFGSSSSGSEVMSGSDLIDFVSAIIQKYGIVQ